MAETRETDINPAMDSHEETKPPRPRRRIIRRQRVAVDLVAWSFVLFSDETPAQLAASV